MKNRIFLTALVLCLSFVELRAQATSFTYQGRLTENGVAVSGVFDLHFTLYATVTNGAPVSQTITNRGVTISDGKFALLLDFGFSPFTGEPRWLETGVRTNNAPEFVILRPRQEITRVPYAISALDVTAPNIPRLSVPNTSVPAAGEAVVTSGFVTGATLTQPGFGYVTSPAVTIQDATGSGAQVVATIENGRVTALTVMNAGTGYSPQADLVIDPPPSNEYQVFQSTNIFAGVSVLTNQNNTIAGSFSGSYTGAYSGSYVGNGTGLTNVDASTLQGLSAASFWRIDGNSNTSPERNFIGTSDNQPLELRANNLRSLRIEPTTNGSPNILGGSPDNYVAPDIYGAVVAGGGSRSGLVLSNATRSSQSTISGGGRNSIADAAPFSTIGGGFDGEIEPASDGATIAGGLGNLIRNSSRAATISGGQNNTVLASVPHATIGGGVSNEIHAGAEQATIAGGRGNQINPGAVAATIGGGFQNTILTNGFYGTIPGGLENSAAHLAFAAGTRAKALHAGAFVWADSLGTEFASTGTDQFLIRARGGVGIGTNDPATQFHVHGTDQTVAIVSGSRGNGTFFGIQNTGGGTRWSIISTGSGNGEGAGRLLFFTHASNDTKMRLEPNGNLIIDGTLTQSSDRDRKKEIQPVDSASVLQKVLAMPVSTWTYKDDEAHARHLGPMAQDFHAAFGLGESDKGIAAIDADGVALAAIQGLNKKVEEQAREIDQLKETLQRLEQVLAARNSGEAR